MERRPLRRTPVALTAALLLAAPLRAQPASTPAAPTTTTTTTARDSVLAVVNAFFAAMASRDSLAILRTMTADAQTWAVASGTDRLPAARALPPIASTIVRSPTAMRERMWDPTVLVHKETAVVWAPYDFHIDGRFSHCGVDAFSLVKGGGEWRIAAITYTVERTGCAPSPLGPLR